MMSDVNEYNGYTTKRKVKLWKWFYKIFHYID